jgi:hypothetical protein
MVINCSSKTILSRAKISLGNDMDRHKTILRMYTEKGIESLEKV